ncbi:MAG: MFS transporter [Simkaniaceae bacterium]|nr:MAG: MFS transporter [Simkaniaceae bacterium]
MSSVKRIFPVLTVLFLGYLGFSLAIPLFPPLFLDPVYEFLPIETTVKMRRILLGILFSMYPLGQFVGAPLLGKLSDKYGRKPILLISLIIVIPAYLGSAFSVLYTLPILLFVSRFLSGLLEGNIVIAQAAIADISEDTKAKTKNFGWLVSLSSTAFFFGPLIGGKLADSSVVSWFHFDTPFWGAAILTLIGFFIVLYLFRETHPPDKEMNVSIKSITRSFTDGLRYNRLRVIYSANFFVFLSIFFFLNFFTAYLVTRFNFSVALLGEVNAYLSIPFMIAPIFFGVFAKWWTSRQAMRLGSLCLCISYLIFVIPQSPWALLITLIPLGFFQSMGFAFPALMVSDAVGKRIQGQALGTNQSIQVFAEAATALTGGFIMAAERTLPIYAAASCSIIAALILFIKPPKVGAPASSS